MIYNLMLNKKYGIVLTVGLIWVLVGVFFLHNRDVESSRILEETIDTNGTPGPKFDVTKRIAYISRHVGTTTDFQYMAKHLLLENVDYYDPQDFLIIVLLKMDTDRL